MNSRGVRLLRRSGVLLCWVLAVAMVACSDGANSSPELPAAAVVVETGPTADAPVGGGAAVPDGSGAVAAAALHSADSLGPFGSADLLARTGPAPTGLQAALGPDDQPGPLLASLRGWRYGDNYRIVDICTRPEVAAAWEAAGGPGALVPHFGMFARERAEVMRQVARCTSDPALCRALHDTRRDNAIPIEEGSNVTLDYLEERCGHLVRFVVLAIEDIHFREYRTRTRAEADRLVADRVRQDAASQTVSVVDMLGLYGSYGGGGYDLGCDQPSQDMAREFACLADLTMEIRFAPADAPADEVRVVAESVAVRDGMLRGLMRNWSRRLWAYGVTVTADSHDFEWPLSMQPGEIAPFEIAGWDGPADAGRIEFQVAANMSHHADPSRAFEFMGPFHFEIGADTRREMPDAVRDRYAHVTADVPPGSVSWAAVRADSTKLVLPASHPSLHDAYELHDGFVHLAVRDLRAYGVIRDSHGRVFDVGPASINVIMSYEYELPHEDRYAEVTSLPHPYRNDYGNFSRDLRVARVFFDVHLEMPATDDGSIGEPGGPLESPHVYYIDEVHEFYGARQGRLHGDYGIWIGAAHPERDSG